MIYFIQDNSTLFIKIGFTDSAPEKRLATLQTGCPSGLKLLLSIEGTKEFEQELHQRFADHRERGEWFRPHPDIVTFLLSPQRRQGDKKPCHTVQPGGLIQRVESRRSPTFAELITLEPQLQLLFDEAKNHHKTAGLNFCANAAWYGYYCDYEFSLKGRLCKLVGWERRDGPPELRSNLAYDVAYQTIYDALPNCGPKCACQVLMGAFLGDEECGKTTFKQLEDRQRPITGEASE